MQSFQTQQAKPAIESAQFASSKPFAMSSKGHAIEDVRKFASMLLQARSSVCAHAGVRKGQGDFSGFEDVMQNSRLSMQKKNTEALKEKKELEDEEEDRKKLAEAQQEVAQAVLLRLDMQSQEKQMVNETKALESTATARSSRLAEALLQHKELQAQQQSTLRAKPHSQSVDSLRARGSELMSQLSDDSSDIELNLNALNKANLASPGQGQVETQASSLTNMSSQDLRSSLDTLAKQANVQRLQLQMQNPQTLAAHRRDAETIATMPHAEQSAQALAKLNLSKTSHVDSVISSQAMLRQKLQMMSHSMVAPENTSDGRRDASHLLVSVAEGGQNPLLQGNMGSEMLTKSLTTPDQRLEQAITSLQQGLVNTSLPQRNVGIAGTPLAALAEDLASFAKYTGRKTDSDDAIAKDDAVLNFAQGFSATDISDVKPKMSSQASFHMGQDATANAEALHEKVMQMAAKNMKHLSVDLMPSELGRMRIAIDVSQDNEAVSVALSAANEQTRELLEQALPKLREILAQQHVATETVVTPLQERQQDNGQNAQNGEQKGQDQAQDEAEMKEVLFGEKASGTVLAKSGVSGTVADNLTGFRPSFSSYRRAGQTLKI